MYPFIVGKQSNSISNLAKLERLYYKLVLIRSEWKWYMYIYLKKYMYPKRNKDQKGGEKEVTCKLDTIWVEMIGSCLSFSVFFFFFFFFAVCSWCCWRIRRFWGWRSFLDWCLDCEIWRKASSTGSTTAIEEGGRERERERREEKRRDILMSSIF